MSRRSLRIALIFVVSTLLVAAVALAFVVNAALDYPVEPQPGSGEVVAVEIESGMAFPSIVRRLAEKGLVERPRWFRVYAMQRGVTTQIKRGRYELANNLSPARVLDALIEGVPDETVPVTLPEGLHMLEIFAILDEHKIAPADELERLARDADFVAARGIVAPSLEGYLFPETYRFRVRSDPARVLDHLITQHRRVWQSIRDRHAERLTVLKKRLGWTDHDFLIMASIVEKEAVVASEQPRIAQVFMNRLLSAKFVPHRLDTDPTIRYGCTVPLEKSAACLKWDPSSRLRRAQLDDVDNPYNTYQHEGLPPGPIANPGAGALEAVVTPDRSRFLFFVSRNDGTHVFSRTRAEHERAVNLYQR